MIIAGPSLSLPTASFAKSAAAPCSCGNCSSCGTTAATQASTEEMKAQAEMLENLQKRDREVRNHEAAHLAAAGGIATGGATFTYQRGPDGQMYAIGGEVQVDTSPVSGDPEATLRKAETIRRAALAPADPSGPDRQAAASAGAMEARAKADLAKKAAEQNAAVKGFFSAAGRTEHPTENSVDLHA